MGQAQNVSKCRKSKIENNDWISTVLGQFPLFFQTENLSGRSRTRLKLKSKNYFKKISLIYRQLRWRKSSNSWNADSWRYASQRLYAHVVGYAKAILGQNFFNTKFLRQMFLSQFFTPNFHAKFFYANFLRQIFYAKLFTPNTFMRQILTNSFLL